MYRKGGLIVLSGVLVAGAAFAQSDSNSPAADQKRTIRVGIAPMQNRSSRQVIPTWERDQLMRELQRLRTDRKSSVILEAVSLEATSREDASPEADKKGCQYLVLTALLDPSGGPSISGGPDGSQRSPILLGNTNPHQTVAVTFTILELGSARTLTEGTTAAPVEDHNDTRAADEAMRLVARRVASELRNRPRSFD